MKRGCYLHTFEKTAMHRTNEINSDEVNIQTEFSNCKASNKAILSRKVVLHSTTGSSIRIYSIRSHLKQLKAMHFIYRNC